jgi:hypothetical protein
MPRFWNSRFWNSRGFFLEPPALVYSPGLAWYSRGIA